MIAIVTEVREQSLIVQLDDDKDVLYACRKILESTGEAYTIEQYSDGILFMDRLAEQLDMDIAILDVHVPQFDLIEAIQRLVYHRPLTYVIVASGDSDASFITKLCNEYNVNYVLKGTNDFAEQLKALVYRFHIKVQKRKEYLLAALAIKEEGNNAG